MHADVGGLEGGSEVNDISKCVGMSEPFPFSFSSSKSPGIGLIFHSVIFTTYEVRDGEATIHFLSEKSDPRARDLIEFILANFLKEKKQLLEAALKSAESAVTLAKAESEVILAEAKAIAVKLAEEHTK